MRRALLQQARAAELKRVTGPAILYQLRQGRLSSWTVGGRRYIVLDQAFRDWTPKRDRRVGR